MSTGEFTESSERGFFITGWDPSGQHMVGMDYHEWDVEALVLLDTSMHVVRRIPLPTSRYAEVVGWSPDGSAIYVSFGVAWRGVAWTGGGFDLARLSVATGDITILARGNLVAASPRDDLIAYWTDRDGNGEANGLSVVGSNGTGLMELVSDTAGVAFHASTPAWSPDGALLGYAVQSVPDAITVHVWDPETGASTQILSKTGEGVGYPRVFWSQDGAHLLVTRGRAAWVV